MKQLFITKGKYAAITNGFVDITTVEDGAVGLYYLSDGSAVSSALDAKKGNIAVVVGRGEGKQPRLFPEVDVKSLQVVKATAQKGSKYKAVLTVPATVKGEEYTILISKMGVGFNERNNWTYVSLAKSTTAKDVAEDLVKQINANKHTLGVTASNADSVITIDADEKGANFSVQGADGLMGVEVTQTLSKKTTLDKAYIQDLASRCAAGKGFDYTYEKPDIYPGYPEPIEADEYVLYSLRFAVPRVAAKQRDEVVWQILHIAVPSDGTAIATLDTIFGTASAAGKNSSQQGTGGTGGVGGDAAKL